MVLRLPIEYRNQFVHISNVVKFSMRPITTDRVLLRVHYTFAFPSMIYPLVGLKFKFTLYADDYSATKSTAILFHPTQKSIDPRINGITF